MQQTLIGAPVRVRALVLANVPVAVLAPANGPVVVNDPILLSGQVPNRAVGDVTGSRAVTVGRAEMAVRPATAQDADLPTGPRARTPVGNHLDRNDPVGHSLVAHDPTAGVLGIRTVAQAEPNDPDPAVQDPRGPERKGLERTRPAVDNALAPLAEVRGDWRAGIGRRASRVLTGSAGSGSTSVPV